MKRQFSMFISFMLSIVILFTLSLPVSAESAIDFESAFQEMDIETLEETRELLLKILNDKKVANAKLLLDPAESNLAVGRTIKLYASSDGREVTPKTVISFESSDPSVAAVQNGTVTGKAPGSATITATATFEDGAVLQASSAVTVIVPVTAVQASTRNATVLAGNTLDIASLVKAVPDNASETGLIYSVDDENVASVSDQGILTGISAGKVNVLITSAENTETPKSVTISVSVNQAVTGISLNETKFDVGNGNTYKLSASISPENATNQNVTWESADPTIASVSRDGTVRGVGTGTTTIVCTADDGSGIKAEATVTVITAIKRLAVDKKEYIVTEGNEAQIGLTITPENPTNKTLTWTSSDESVAKVSPEGVIDAVSDGSCSITVSTNDGTDISITIPVYVEPANPVVIESISWKTSWGMRTGKMAVYATNKCSKRTIKSFDYTVFCVKGTEYYGSIPIQNGWTTDLSFSKSIRPGQELKGKYENVSGFAAVDEVQITPTKVYFTDGTEEEIPSDAQYTSTFSVY